MHGAILCAYRVGNITQKLTMVLLSFQYFIFDIESDTVDGVRFGLKTDHSDLFTANQIHLLLELRL